MGSRGASCRRRLLRRRQTVYSARQPRACLATSGVGGERPRLRGAYWLRALQAAQLPKPDCVARSAGGRDRSNRPCSRRDDSFAVDRLGDSARVAPRAYCMAGHHCCSGVSRCPCDSGHATSGSLRALATNSAQLLDIRASYDSAADAYVQHLFTELEQKPLDRHILNRFAEAVRGRGLVADLGCGPGHVAKYLHEQGVNVCGIDLSPEMIRCAARLSPGLAFQVGDMTSLDLPAASLAGIVAFYSRHGRLTWAFDRNQLVFIWIFRQYRESVVIKDRITPPVCASY